MGPKFTFSSLRFLAYSLGMITALMMIVIIAGLLVLNTSFFWGLLIMAAGFWIGRRQSPEDEDRLMGVLLILAGAGVALVYLDAIFS